MHIFNFSAGPAVLPAEVLAQARDELLDWHGSGMSVMEMSHRGKEFISIAESAETDLRELLAIPASYKVLFLQGGATRAVRDDPDESAARKEEGGLHPHRRVGQEGDRRSEASSALSTWLRAAKTGSSPMRPSRPCGSSIAEAAYVHYTGNETIGGVEFHWIPQTGACRWCATCPPA